MTNDTTMALGVCAAVAAVAIGIGTFAANYKLGIAVNEPDAPMMETRWTLDGCETVCRPVVPRDMGRK